MKNFNLTLGRNNDNPKYTANFAMKEYLLINYQLCGLKNGVNVYFISAYFGSKY